MENTRLKIIKIINQYGGFSKLDQGLRKLKKSLRVPGDRELINNAIMYWSICKTFDCDVVGDVLSNHVIADRAANLFERLALTRPNCEFCQFYMKIVNTIIRDSKCRPELKLV